MKLVQCEKQFSGKLTKGCQQCIKGRKSVIFITGLCHYKCFYCPISDDKRKVDIVKVNELILKTPDTNKAIKDLIKEMELCQSKGCSFTGGDPLAKIERTTKYINALKKHFGKSFHIHLYTSLEFLTQEKIDALAKAGLDELRFHPNIEQPNTWGKMLLNTHKLVTGIEVPAIPDKLKEIKQLIDFAKKHKFKFINLNELEISDTNDKRLSERKYKLKNNISYALKGSQETALKCVTYGEKINFSVHYCSCQFKDAVQLANRLRLRAESIHKSYTEVDEEGMITKGEIYSIKKITLKQFEEIQEYFDIPSELIVLEKGKILIAPWVLRDIWKEIKTDFPNGKNYFASVTKTYPTADEFILEKEELF
ncbi:MAG: radical SAM protein [Candidatus Nanoarchaeia archaeon]|nr:radical SAM protein [Candidatus Nanoarchaeia archaeon]